MDRNVREVTVAEWAWAELVIISEMIVQKDDMALQIARAKERASWQWALRQLNPGCTGTGPG